MKNAISILLILLFFAVSPLIYGHIMAAYFSFDPATSTVTTGGTFTVKVVVNAGTDKVVSADAYVLFDPDEVEVVSVTAGDFFPTVTNNTTSDKVYIVGLVDDTTLAKSGSGTLATLSLKSKGMSGTLSFDCQTESSTTSKIVKDDVDITNVIVCSSNTTHAFTASGTTTGTPTPTSLTPTPSVLPTTGLYEYINQWSLLGSVLVLGGLFLKLKTF